MNTDNEHIELGEVEFVEDVYEQGEPPVPVHPLYEEKHLNLYQLVRVYKRS